MTRSYQGVHFHLKAKVWILSWVWHLRETGLFKYNVKCYTCWGARCGEILPLCVCLLRYIHLLIRFKINNHWTISHEFSQLYCVTLWHSSYTFAFFFKYHPVVLLNYSVMQWRKKKWLYKLYRQSETVFSPVFMTWELEKGFTRIIFQSSWFLFFFFFYKSKQNKKWARNTFLIFL